MKKSRKLQMDFNTEQLQESDTYCPSVERVLLKFILQALFKQCKLEELLVQSQLKKAGIQTAEALIQVLYEEIKSLKSHKQSLENQISRMLRQFSEKEEHLKRQINFLQNDLRQVLEVQNLKAAELRDMNSRSSLSKCFIPTESRKLSAPNTHRSIQKRLEQKVQSTQSPIRKISLFQTVSKEYIDQQDIKIEAKMCQDVVTALLSDDVEGLVVNFEEISNLIKEENDELMEYTEKHEGNIQKVKQLSKELKISQKKQLKSYQNTEMKIKYQQSGSKSLSKKQVLKGQKLFSTENSNEASPQRMKIFSPWEDNIKEETRQENPQKSIIKEYQEIIQQYKEYSAYLRAYLCSCIGFISKSTQEMAENNTIYCLESERLKNSFDNECLSTDRTNDGIAHFPSNMVFEVILKDILSTFQDKIHMEHDLRKELEEENRQLRLILDQLVENLKKNGVKPGDLKKPHKQASKQDYSSHSPDQFSQSQVPKTRNFDKKQILQQNQRRRDSKNQRSSKPYKKLSQPPHFHRITLTEYKRYQNEEE